MKGIQTSFTEAGSFFFLSFYSFFKADGSAFTFVADFSIINAVYKMTGE